MYVCASMSASRVQHACLAPHPAGEPERVLLHETGRLSVSVQEKKGLAINMAGGKIK